METQSKAQPKLPFTTVVATEGGEKDSYTVTEWEPAQDGAIKVTMKRQLGAGFVTRTGTYKDGKLNAHEGSSITFAPRFL